MGDADDFEVLRMIFPSRSGSQRWGDARRFYSARRAEGHAAVAIMQGVERYAAWCDATGKTGTEMVMQAATFLGRNLCFLEAWKIQPEVSAFERTKQKLKEASNVVSIQGTRPGKGSGTVE